MSASARDSKLKGCIVEVTTMFETHILLVVIPFLRFSRTLYQMGAEHVIVSCYNKKIINKKFNVIISKVISNCLKV